MSQAPLQQLARYSLHTDEAVEIHLVHQLATALGWHERSYTAYDRKLASVSERVEKYAPAGRLDARVRLKVLGANLVSVTAR